MTKEQQSENVFRVDGKLALVTGAASGIGAAIAIALAKAGARVAVHGNRHSALETARQIGSQACSFEADLNHPEAPQSLFESVTAQCGTIDILVNNAGAIYRERAEDYPLAEWNRLLQINLTSAFALSQQVARPLIAAQRPGKIVNIASLLSFQGGIGVAAYAASKGGIAQMTKALANEWAAHQIQVNAIAPGYIATNNTLPLQQDATRNRQILERIPAGRWGTPQDIASTAVFLCSAASNYITGTVIAVDGGWLSR